MSKLTSYQWFETPWWLPDVTVLNAKDASMSWCHHGTISVVYSFHSCRHGHQTCSPNPATGADDRPRADRHRLLLSCWPQLSLRHAEWNYLPGAAGVSTDDPQLLGVPYDPHTFSSHHLAHVHLPVVFSWLATRPRLPTPHRAHGVQNLQLPATSYPWRYFLWLNQPQDLEHAGHWCTFHKPNFSGCQSKYRKCGYGFEWISSITTVFILLETSSKVFKYIKQLLFGIFCNRG